MDDKEKENERLRTELCHAIMHMADLAAGLRQAVDALEWASDKLHHEGAARDPILEVLPGLRSLVVPD